MGRVNILILVDKFDYHGSHINGPTRVYSWLVKAVDTTRFNVHLYALRGKGKSDAIFQNHNVNVSYFTLGRYDARAIWRIIKEIRRLDVDILHLTGYGSTTFGRIAGAVCGRPCILHEHWVDPSITWTQCQLERVLSGFTTVAIAPSEYAREFLVMKKGFREEQVVLVRNGVPLHAFYGASRQKAQRMRQEWGIRDDVTVVGMVGMLHENKGHRYVIEAARLVGMSGRRTHVLIVGEGELRGELEKQVSELGLNGQVVFMGEQDNMPEVLSMIDIFVSASRTETAPLSLLEAMAAGKAIVTSDSGGGREVIKDGATGLVVPVEDAKAIAEKIEYLISNPMVCELLSRNAQAESRQHDISAAAKAVEHVWEEIAGRV